MVDRKSFTLCTSKEKLPGILNDLRKYGASIEEGKDSVTCEIQSSNTVYNISIEVFDDPAEMLNCMECGFIPVTSFEELQLKTIGKVVWNWR